MAREPEVIILAGPPGGGKGTYIKKVIEESCRKRGLKMAVAPVSDALRLFLDENPSIAEPLRAEMKAGLLVSDSVVNEVFMLAVKQLERHEEDVVYVFDGAPRTFGQIETSLVKGPEHLGVKKITVVHFETPHHICGFRVAKRGREDDTEEAFAVRWGEYLLKTVPAIDHIVENAKVLNVRRCKINGQFIRSSAGLYQRMLDDH